MMNTKNDALAISCSKCHADAGSHCVTSTGAWSKIHATRLAEYDAAMDEDDDDLYSDAELADVEASEMSLEHLADVIERVQHDRHERRAHKECSHESTKAARAKCRSQRRHLING